MINLDVLNIIFKLKTVTNCGKDQLVPYNLNSL